MVRISIVSPRCYKDYPGLGNRSIFYPGSSVGSTITFGVIEDTSSNPTSNISFKKKCLRVSYYKHIYLGPQDLDRSLGRHVRPYTETRQPIRPEDPAVPRGGECYKDNPGLGNRSIVYPGSSVGSTITMPRGVFTPILTEIRKNVVWDFHMMYIPDTFYYRHNIYIYIYYIHSISIN